MTGRIIRLLENAGCDAAALCRRAGVSLEQVSNPESRVPYRLSDALVEACVAELGADGFAVALSLVVDEQTYDAAGLVLLSSPSLGEGLERAFAYQRLWADGERFTLRRDRGEGVIGFTHPGRSSVARAVLSELAFVETMNAARVLVDPSARAVRVTFAHARTSSLAPALGVEPLYEARRNELVLDAALLAAPVHAPEGALAYMHEVVAKRALSTLPAAASVAARLRALCKHDPSKLVLDLTGAAALLRISSRTLQRKLAAEGTSWSDLVDEARRALVTELDLRSSADKEIAFLVGFSDPSALTRARARWASGR